MIRGKFAHNSKHVVMLKKHHDSNKSSTVDGGSMISIKTKNPTLYTQVKQPETIGKPIPAPVSAVISGNGLDLIQFPKQIKKKKITLSSK